MSNNRAALWIMPTTKIEVDELLAEIPLGLRYDDLVKVAIRRLKKEFRENPNVIIQYAFEDQEHLNAAS